MTLNKGDQLGPYEIEAPIGAGGMGEVFRARDTRLGREVAIKVLASLLAKDPDRLRRFEQEARAASLLNHPNILNVHDIGTQGEIPYVVYELLEGENLRSRMHSTSVSPKKAIDHALQVARGLAAAHEKGIVHRDLKPENLFITRDGHIKILDFGLAKLTQPLDSGSASNLQTAAGTEAGVIMGTVGYMSPEQVRGQAVDHRSDIFSFGAILYEMLNGQRAFQGDSTVETMNAILKTDPPEVRVSSGPTSPAVDRVVKHCLEKNPDDRFQSAHDLAFALETLSSISSSELLTANIRILCTKANFLITAFFASTSITAHRVGCRLLAYKKESSRGSASAFNLSTRNNIQRPIWPRWQKHFLRSKLEWQTNKGLSGSTGNP